MAEWTDVRVEDALRATLRREVDGLPVVVTPEDVMARRRARRRTVMRPWLLLAAAVLLVPFALVVGALSLAPQREPTYRAVMVRGLEPAADGATVSDLEVLLVRPDGRVDSEVVVPASRLAGWASASYPKLSPDGRWLAFGLVAAQGGDEATAIVDLHAPDAEARVLPGPGLIGWGPDDTLWRAPSGPLEHIDPVSGATVAIDLESSDLTAWPWPSWGLAVVADGSGAVLIDPTSLGLADGRLPGNLRWATLGEDGTVRDGHGVPDLAPAVGPRIASADSGVLQVCDSDPAASAYCRDLPRGSVISQWADGTPTRTWRGAPQADEFVRSASWAAGGGVWLLVDRRDGGRMLGLVHVGSDGRESDGPAFAAAPGGGVAMSGLAPDDSMVAIDWVDDVGFQTVLVDPGSGRSIQHRGQLAGFVGPGETAAWISRSDRGSDGRPLPASPAAEYPGYPPLMSIEEQLGSEPDPFHVLLMHEQPATSGRPGGPTRVTLGPVAIEEGYEVSLVCSGPSDVTYQFTGESPGPVVSHCEQQGPYGEGAPGATGGPVSLTVIADTATAWRLVVADPPPPGYLRRATAPPAPSSSP